MKNILIFILALGFFACKQDPEPTEPPTGCGMTIDQFPLKVGNSWTYQVFQSVDGGGPYQFLEKIKINIIGLTVIEPNDTIFSIETVHFISGDTSDYFIDSISKKKNKLFPYLSVNLHNSDGSINFPLKCTGVDTIQNFYETDPLFSVILKEAFAINDTNIIIKGKNEKALKCLRYERTKILEIDYSNLNVFQWYFIVPNIGIVQTEIRGINHYPFSANFNYMYKLVNYKIL